MTVLIIIVVFAVAAITAAWVVPRRRAVRKERETADDAAVKDLYDHYLVGIDGVTQSYLLRAPSDEEWLAGIKAEAGKRAASRRTGVLVLDSSRAATRDGREDQQSRRRGYMSGLSTVIVLAGLTGIGMAAADALGHLGYWWLLIAVPLALGSLAGRVIDLRHEKDPVEWIRAVFRDLGIHVFLPLPGIYGDIVGQGGESDRCPGSTWSAK